MELLLLIGGVVLVMPLVSLVLAIRASGRAGRVELDAEAARLDRERLEERVGELAKRVKLLESDQARTSPTAIAPAEEPAAAQPPDAPPELAPAASPTPEPVETASVIVPPEATLAEPPAPVLMSTEAAEPMTALTDDVPGDASDDAPEPDAVPSETWEVTVGTSWLNKLGIVVLSLGVVFFLSYTLQNIGPLGKALVGVGVGATLLGLGVLAGRRERYRVVSRTLFGGGWAIVYVTVYAMHHVEAVHLIDSPLVALTMLLAVAGAMVVHTLRYDSELATGFAYGIAFLSLGLMTNSGAGSLVASALLGASIVYVLARRRWYVLEPLAVVATYGVHGIWVTPLLEAAGGRGNLPSNIELASAGLLALYWLIWSVSSFVRVDRTPKERALLAGAGILNLGGYLALTGYQSDDPSRAFWFFSVLGLAYVAQAAIARRLARRTIFVLTSTLGATLLAVAVPYRYSEARLHLAWLVEAEALLIVGWRLAERHLRTLGWTGSALLFLYLAVPLFEHAEQLVYGGGPDAAFGVELAAIATAYFLNARLLPRWLGEHAGEGETRAADVSHVGGTALAMAAAWVALPLEWVGLAWMGIALALGWWSSRNGSRWLMGCAHGVAGAALVPTLAVNVPNQHAVMLAAVALAYFLNARLLPRWAGPDVNPIDEMAGNLSYVAGTYTALAATWAAVPPAWVGLSWVAVAVALGEWGGRLRSRWLQGCGHGAAAVALLRLLTIELGLESAEIAGISVRLLTVAVAAALFYMQAARLRTFVSTPAAVTDDFDGEPAGPDADRHGINPIGRLSASDWPAAYSWGASLLVGFLIWAQATSAAVGIGWGLAGLVLVEVGRWRSVRPLRLQGQTLLFASLVRIFVADLNGIDIVGAVPVRILTIGLLSAIYYYAAFSAPRSERDAPMHLSWYAAVALSALLLVELWTDLPLWVPVAWTVLVAVWYWAGSLLAVLPLCRQALLLAIAATGYIVTEHVLPALAPAGLTSERALTMGATSVLLAVALARALMTRRAAAFADAEPHDGRWAVGPWLLWIASPEGRAHRLLFFLAVIILTTAIGLDVERRFLTAAWGIEAVALFFVTLPLGERAFRWFSMGLLLLAVSRMFLVDVWALEPLGRIVSFLALGVSLMLVSFLYARFKERIWRYL